MTTEPAKPSTHLLEIERQKVLDFLASIGLSKDEVCGMLITPSHIVVKSYVLDPVSGTHVIVNDPETGEPYPDTKFEHIRIND